MANITANHPLWLQQILIHHLSQDPDVVAILGERPAVVWGWGRDVVEATQTQPVINLQYRGAGGPAALSSPVSTPGLWIYAFSNRSQGEAMRLHVAYHKVIQGEGLGAPLDGSGSPCFPACVRMTDQGGLVDGYNTVAGAWFFRNNWRARVWGI